MWKLILRDNTIYKLMPMFYDDYVPRNYYLSHYTLFVAFVKISISTVICVARRLSDVPLKRETLIKS